MPKQKPSASREWLSESLRLTAFPREGTRLGQAATWSKLVGSEPETSQSHPRQLTSREVGPYGKGRLSMEAMPDRTHLRLISNPDPEKSLFENLAIGTFSETQAEFAQLMKKWLKSSPTLNRLAFGAVLLKPVQDTVAGHKLLAKYLPRVKIDTDRSTDLSYQINRKRLSGSGIRGLVINRLSKWSVVTVSSVVVGVGNDASEIISPRDSSETVVAARLELDINTAVEYRRGLPKGKLTRLFDELLALGSEIASKGDIA